MDELQGISISGEDIVKAVMKEKGNVKKTVEVDVKVNQTTSGGDKVRKDLKKTKSEVDKLNQARERLNKAFATQSGFKKAQSFASPEQLKDRVLSHVMQNYDHTVGSNIDPAQAKKSAKAAWREIHAFQASLGGKENYLGDLTKGLDEIDTEAVKTFVETVPDDVKESVNSYLELFKDMIIVGIKDGEEALIKMLQDGASKLNASKANTKSWEPINVHDLEWELDFDTVLDDKEVRKSMSSSIAAGWKNVSKQKEANKKLSFDEKEQLKIAKENQAQRAVAASQKLQEAQAERQAYLQRYIISESEFQHTIATLAEEDMKLSESLADLEDDEYEQASQRMAQIHAEIYKYIAGQKAQGSKSYIKAQDWLKKNISQERFADTHMDQEINANRPNYLQGFTAARKTGVTNGLADLEDWAKGQLRDIFDIEHFNDTTDRRSVEQLEAQTEKTVAKLLSAIPNFENVVKGIQEVAQIAAKNPGQEVGFVQSDKGINGDVIVGKDVSIPLHAGIDSAFTVHTHPDRKYAVPSYDKHSASGGPGDIGAWYQGMSNNFVSKTADRIRAVIAGAGDEITLFNLSAVPTNIRNDFIKGLSGVHPNMPKGTPDSENSYYLREALLNYFREFGLENVNEIMTTMKLSDFMKITPESIRSASMLGTGLIPQNADNITTQETIADINQEVEARQKNTQAINAETEAKKKQQSVDQRVAKPNIRDTIDLSSLTKEQIYKRMDAIGSKYESVDTILKDNNIPKSKTAKTRKQKLEAAKKQILERFDEEAEIQQLLDSTADNENPALKISNYSQFRDRLTWIKDNLLQLQYIDAELAKYEEMEKEAKATIQQQQQQAKEEAFKKAYPEEYVKMKQQESSPIEAATSEIEEETKAREANTIAMKGEAKAAEEVAKQKRASVAEVQDLIKSDYAYHVADSDELLHRTGVTESGDIDADIAQYKERLKIYNDLQQTQYEAAAKLYNQRLVAGEDPAVGNDWDQYEKKIHMYEDYIQTIQNRLTELAENKEIHEELFEFDPLTEGDQTQQAISTQNDLQEETHETADTVQELTQAVEQETEAHQEQTQVQEANIETQKEVTQNVEAQIESQHNLTEAIHETTEAIQEQQTQTAKEKADTSQKEDAFKKTKKTPDSNSPDIYKQQTALYNKRYALEQQNLTANEIQKAKNNIRIKDINAEILALEQKKILNSELIDSDKELALTNLQLHNKENLSNLKAEIELIRQKNQAEQEAAQAEQKVVEAEKKSRKQRDNQIKQDLKSSLSGSTKEYERAQQIFNDGQILPQFSDEVGVQLQIIKNNINEVNSLMAATHWDIPEQVDLVRQKINDLKLATKDGLIPDDKISADTDQINRLIKQLKAFQSANALSSESNNAINQWKSILNDDVSVSTLKDINSQFIEMQQRIKGTSEEGKSFSSLLKERFSALGAYLSTFASFYQIIDQVRNGLRIIHDLDDALTEMAKVSEEPLSRLKEFQTASYDIANAAGTTGLVIQQSTADFMRLGQSLDQAQRSAKNASVLLNVSEFSDISEATDALIAMSAAYDDLSQEDILDKLNNIGNNFSISTEGLATALQNSAATLRTANNDIDESIALITAGERLPEIYGNIYLRTHLIALTA